jgi:hypothetical protein
MKVLLSTVFKGQKAKNTQMSDFTTIQRISILERKNTSLYFRNPEIRMNELGGINSLKAFNPSKLSSTAML